MLNVKLVVTSVIQGAVNCVAPALINVHKPDPIVRVLVVELELANLPAVTL